MKKKYTVLFNLIGRVLLLSLCCHHLGRKTLNEYSKNGSGLPYLPEFYNHQAEELSKKRESLDLQITLD